jgi:hypothetical protein
MQWHVMLVREIIVESRLQRLLGLAIGAFGPTTLRLLRQKVDADLPLSPI